MSSNNLILAKFFVPKSRDDLIPYGFERIDQMPVNEQNEHFNTLKRLGLAELVEWGRKRPGKRDSGENTAIEMASAPEFIRTMESQGLGILSARRYLDEKKNPKKPRYVVVLGIGFGQRITFGSRDQKKIEALFSNVWQFCHVWDNSASRAAGSVDTINFTGCLSPGAKPVYELFVNNDGALEMSPFNPAAKNLPLTPSAGRAV